MIQEYQYSFEFVIEDVHSKAESNEHILSSIVCCGGCQWKLSVEFEDNVTAVLHFLSSTRTSKRIPTSFKLSILKPDGSEGMSREFNYTFGEDFSRCGAGLGVTDWIDKDVLISEYVTDDSVTFKAEINTFSAKFGDPSLDESCFKLLKMDTDVTLVIDEKEIKAHRLVLAQGSEYLRKVLNLIRGNEVILYDCDYKATLTAVRFIYTKECIVDSGNFQKVLEMGKKFGLMDLVLACSELLTLDNVSLYCIVIGGMWFSVNFDQLFWDYAVKNISAVLESNMFWNLTNDQIMTFIKRPEINENVNPDELEAITRAATVRKGMPAVVKDPRLCVICQFEKLDTVIFPCKHFALCTKDAKELWRAESKKCPLCQGDVRFFIKADKP